MQTSLQSTLILVAAMAAAFGARAQEATPEPVRATLSTTSRAEVQQQLAAARADGTIAAVSAGYDFARRMVATKSRAQVHTELLAARAGDELVAINREAHEFRGATRATVYAQR
jgi:H+/gluconate symporter-like permease